MIQGIKINFKSEQNPIFKKEKMSSLLFFGLSFWEFDLLGSLLSEH